MPALKRRVRIARALYSHFKRTAAIRIADGTENPSLPYPGSLFLDLVLNQFCTVIALQRFDCAELLTFQNNSLSQC